MNPKHILGSPKSTLVGLCILLLAVKSSVHFVNGHLAMSEQDWFGVGFGALAQVVTMFQADCPQDCQK